MFGVESTLQRGAVALTFILMLGCASDLVPVASQPSATSKGPGAGEGNGVRDHGARVLGGQLLSGDAQLACRTRACAGSRERA